MTGYNFIEIIKTRILKSELGIKNFFLFLIRSLLFTNYSTVNVKKIIIYRTGSIGDNITALPAITALRNHFKNTHIDILTHSGEADYGQINQIIKKGVVQRVINYKGLPLLKLIKELRSEQYDLFVELPKASLTVALALRNMSFAKLIGVKYAFGWEVYFPLFFKKTFNTFFNKRESERLLDIISKYGINSIEATYPLNITGRDEETIFEMLKFKGLTDKTRNIAIVPMAKYPYKIWPTNYYKAVINYLTDKGYNVFIVGTEPFEHATNSANIYDFSGKLTLMQSATLFKHCSLVLTNDTGPMHLADAVGTPIVALFSASNYKGLWYPSYSNTVIRNENVPCVLCLKNTCNDNICMKSISVEVVIDAINKKINLDKFLLK